MVGFPNLLDLPPELLSHLFLHLTTEAFLQLAFTCKHIFEVARQSRPALSAHIDEVPGIKLGLEATTISSAELFILLRQRASENLISTSIHADCEDVRLDSDQIDASASAFRSSADYFNGCLVLKNSLIVRPCTSDGYLLKENISSPYAYGSAKIIFAVQSKHSVSVLYNWKPEPSQTDIAAPKSPTLRPAGSSRDRSRSSNRSNPTVDTYGNPDEDRYHLVHYSAYSYERPIIYFIEFPYRMWEFHDSGDGSPQRGSPFVPVHLAVQDRRTCVVIWRANFETQLINKASSSPIIVLYQSDRLPMDHAGDYTPTILYPLRKPSRAKPSLSTNVREWSECQKRLSAFIPTKTSFCELGTRLKLYQAGSVVPYAIIPTFAFFDNSRPEFVYTDRIHCYNRIELYGHVFRHDGPFHGTHRHGAIVNEADDGHDVTRVCNLSWLFLACLTTDNPSIAGRWQDDDTLFIMQTHDAVDPEDCEHHVQEDPSVRPADAGFRSRIVARLRGLSEHWPLTTMTALDTVSISGKGTRIAIACWDKVLVYAIDPSVLIEDWEADDGSSSDAEEENDSNDSNTVSTADHDQDSQGVVQSVAATQSTTTTVPAVEVPNVPRICRQAMVKGTRFYKLSRDPDFGEIVELWPEVLHLPRNTVARKLMWAMPMSNAYAEVFADSGDESLLLSDDSDDEDDTSNSQAENEADSENYDGENYDGEADPNSSVGSGRPHRRPTMLGTDAFLVNHAPLHDDNRVSPHLRAFIDKDVDMESDAPSTTANIATTAASTAASAAPSTHDVDMTSPAEGRDKGKARELSSSLDGNDTGSGSENKDTRKDKATKKARRRRKRRSEDQLVVMTDRGLQVWDLGPQARARRMTRLLKVGEEGGGKTV